MNLLQLQNASKAYGAKILFHDSSFSVNSDERVGVIGPNGAGKSTLFRALLNEEALDDGLLVKANSLRLGHIPQHDPWGPQETAAQYLERMTKIVLWKVFDLAADFGFDEARLAMPAAQLSGGFRMRVKLLAMISQEPNLMLLDEPTNYLDLESVMALENFLVECETAFMVISHDREFLRRVTDHTLEVEGGDITKFNGHIDDYFEQKAMLREQLERQALSADAKRKEVLDFAARFGAKATKARQVQSRLKRLEKMDKVELKPLPQIARMNLPTPERTGRFLARAEGLKLGYGDRTVLDRIDFPIERGDKIAVVGPNGAGKSTLLKALSQVLVPLAGKLEWAADVRVSYFAQHLTDSLDERDTVMSAIESKARPDVARQEILDLAGGMLFSGDDLSKPIRVLSGGEKTRVVLLQILVQRAPLLILDEPTNHLDFYTVEALTQALQRFDGTVIVVSHDRAFVRRVATKILALQDGSAHFYPGDYDDYAWGVARGLRSNRSSTTPSTGPAIEAGAPVTPAFNHKARRKELEKAIRQLEKQLADLESQSSRHTASMAMLNDRLLAITGADAAQTVRELAATQTLLENCENAWMVAADDLQARRDELQALLGSTEPAG